MMSRGRADRLLVARGLFESRARAQAAIAAGLVRADGVRVRKPSEEISSDANIEAVAEHPYVSRGGVKLAAALDHFSLEIKGRVCLDVGASTGGFSEVLLLGGAKRVYAVDVGTAQLHPRLHNCAQLVSLENTDIRKLDPALLDETPDFATVDVSFISLKLVLPSIGPLLKSRAAMVALIKPQFETSRSTVKKGVIRDPAIHAAICDDIAAFISSLGWRGGGIMPSPIPGGDGNREFVIEAERG
jgi:23S rRNA (cytidine1920-2'-O)/16S rRNA (cytidine1409-2'-O)-methyltransferase